MFAIFRRSFKDFDLFFNHLENVMAVGDDLKDFTSVEVRISGDNAPMVFMKYRTRTLPTSPNIAAVTRNTDIVILIEDLIASPLEMNMLLLTTVSLPAVVTV